MWLHVKWINSSKTCLINWRSNLDLAPFRQVIAFIIGPRISSAVIFNIIFFFWYLIPKIQVLSHRNFFSKNWSQKISGKKNDKFQKILDRSNFLLHCSFKNILERNMKYINKKITTLKFWKVFWFNHQVNFSSRIKHKIW